jgi:hypothetical protein
MMRDRSASICAGSTLEGTIETIPSAKDGLDVLRVPRVISEGIANFSDGGVNAVISIEVAIFSPQSLNDLLAANQPSIFPDQEDEQIHGDAFHAHRFPGASQLIPAYVQDELSELYSL